MSDRKIIEWIFNGDITVKHEFSERFSADFVDALREIVREYDELKESEELFKMAEKHIDKLESMLDRRKARYKRWEDVHYD